MKALRTLLLGIAVCFLLGVTGCHWLPEILHGLNPSVTYRVPNAGRTLFLTLDDGPSEATPQILDVLRKHGVHATFFITTDHIRPEMMKRIVSDGHQVASHLKRTSSLDRLSDSEFEADFLASDKALAAYNPVKLFRPPGGSISTKRAKYATAHGYEIIVGTIFPLDHWLENEAAIKTLAQMLVVEGGIMILHDTATRGPRTVRVLDDLIPRLKRQGYCFSLLPVSGVP